MPDEKTDENKEFDVMKGVYEALSSLQEPARNRVIAYILSRFEISIPQSGVKRGGEARAEAAADVESLQSAGQGPNHGYTEFAELFAAASPRSTGDKALLAGYWIQVCQGGGKFDAQAANTILKNLGEGLANITSAIDTIKSQKPQLVLQLRKSGTTQQARKTYLVTTAGIKAVENMLQNGESS